MTKSPDRVRISGPLQTFAFSFHQELARQGYEDGGVTNQLRLLAHLSRWLEVNGVAPTELTTEAIGQYLAARRSAGYTHWLSARGLTPVLDHLRHLGVVPSADGADHSDPVDALVVRYREYLVSERGLAGGTVSQYGSTARRFLLSRGENRTDRLRDLDAGEVVNFVREEAGRHSPAFAKRVVTALRSFLRFCYLEGIIARPLYDAVPAVARFRMTSVPRFLERREVDALLDSCDRSTPTGMRDFAIIVALSRLGLRACEVAALELGDLDWRRGEMLVRGKARREERLPMPQDVGEATASYLLGGRPSAESRAVFLRSCAPRIALSAEGVIAVVNRAAMSAGLGKTGSHCLRHTAATQMLSRGAALEEIALVLRQRDIANTGIYAKVDLATLRTLARPWPGASS